MQAQDSKARLAAEDRQEEVARKAEELQKAEAVRADRTPAQPRALFTLPTAATEVTSRYCCSARPAVGPRGGGVEALNPSNSLETAVPAVKGQW